MRQIPDNIPVSILSVVGAFRTGKSFLLDFFLDYLKRLEAGETGTSIFEDYTINRY